jgi:hypothetical protein
MCRMHQRAVGPGHGTDRGDRPAAAVNGCSASRGTSELIGSVEGPERIIDSSTTVASIHEELAAEEV